MTSIQIEEKWLSVDYSGPSEFEFKRLDADCRSELNIGLNLKFDRCLILELPRGVDAEIQSLTMENLTLSYYNETNYIVVQLLDSSYNDLFNDLILSIYQHIHLLSSPSEYIQAFIHTFHKWTGFFDTRKAGKLQPDELKGIFGELLFLRDLLSTTGALKFNEILSSWRGPYGQSKDFVTNMKDTEVKTIDTIKNDIAISSEYQLEPEPGKTIELAVVAVEADFLNGISLKTLVSDLKNLIIEKQGDTTILFEALFQKGLSVRNLFEYDNFRFRPLSLTVYDCCRKDFPKISRSTLVPEIFQVSFHLRLSLLNDFILHEKALVWK